MAPTTRSSTRQSNLTRKLTIVAIFAAAFSSLIYYLNSHLDRFYIFNLDPIAQALLQAIEAHGNDTRSVVAYIVDDLSTKLPGGYINLDEEWLFNNAGGAMGGMYIIHASITEYLIIFGTAVGTEGHSGRHTADNYFHIIRGTQLAYSAGQFDPEIYPQGTINHTKRGSIKQYKMDEACFALEYSRGWIPPMMAFGLADAFTSTLDFVDTVEDYLGYYESDGRKFNERETVKFNDSRRRGEPVGVCPWDKSESYHGDLQPKF